MGKPKRFLLRLEPELYDALERWAADDLRSINGQIEYTLKKRPVRLAGTSHANKTPPPKQKDSKETLVSLANEWVITPS